MGPWTAIAPLIALSTDPLDEIRTRALRLLKQLGEKHPRYFDADRLASGVAAAQAFHATLAAANTTPLRKNAAPPTAQHGLAAVYAQAVQPQRSLRLDFLKALLRRFRVGSCLNTSGAAEADLPLLAFAASVTAGLPYRRGDEPCTLVQEINAIISMRGDNVVLELRRSLEGEAAAGAAAAAAGAEASRPAGSPAALLIAQCKASLALSMLLVLKDYLKQAYGLTSERVAAFGTSAEKRRVEERQVRGDKGRGQGQHARWGAPALGLAAQNGWGRHSWGVHLRQHPSHPLPCAGGPWGCRSSLQWRCLSSWISWTWRPPATPRRSASSTGSVTATTLLPILPRPRACHRRTHMGWGSCVGASQCAFFSHALMH